MPARRQFTEAHRKKLSISKMGNNNPMYGKFGEENPIWNSVSVKCDTCLKIIIRQKSHLLKHNFCSKKCFGEWLSIYNRDSNNPVWKGKYSKTYRGLHKWIEVRLKKPDTCESCNKSGLKGHKIHWANRSQRYLQKLTDWIRLCAKCHKQYDTKLNLSNYYSSHI